MSDLRPYSGNVDGAVYDLTQGLLKFAADLKNIVKSNPGILPEAAMIGAAVISDLLPLIGSLVTAEQDVATDLLGAGKSASLALFDGLPALLLQVKKA